MERVGGEGESLLLIFIERLIGLILIIIGVILLHGVYGSWAALGEAISLLFTAVSIVFLILGLIMLLSKTE